MKRTKIIQDQYFQTLKEVGHCVPRDKQGQTLESIFKVGREYIVRGDKTENTLNVRCTQNCPCALIVIN